MDAILVDAGKATIGQLGQKVGEKHNEHAIVLGAETGITSDVTSRHVVGGVVEKGPRGHGEPNIIIS